MGAGGSDSSISSDSATASRGQRAPGLAGWCARQSIGEVVVVSPHLDDGVFSAHSVLSRTDGPRRVLATVFSDAPADGTSDWARRTGFASTGDEFAARRLEDRAAAQLLGADCLQLDEHVTAWSDSAARRVTDRLLAALHGPAHQALCLLPAGAGGRLTPLQRWLRRARRAPLGALPHGEHLAVRDGLLAPLRAGGVRVGYYAELPYVWSDRLAELSARLSADVGEPTQMVDARPDVAAKHAACSAYRSQIEPILGVKPAYQRRVLSHREVFFLPA